MQSRLFAQTKTASIQRRTGPEGNNMACRKSCPAGPWVLLVVVELLLMPLALAAGLGNSELEIAIGAWGCTVLALPVLCIKGQTLQVGARAATAAAGGEPGEGGGCHAGQMR